MASPRNRNLRSQRALPECFVCAASREEFGPFLGRLVDEAIVTLLLRKWWYSLYLFVGLYRSRGRDSPVLNNIEPTVPTN
jgi:hypothetical protein